jgi:hypothetical protein
LDAALCIDQGRHPVTWIAADFPGLERIFIERGGIIGIAEIVDCVACSSSPWFVGPYGFVLRNARRLPFKPLQGRLGLFNAPDDVYPAHLLKQPPEACAALA